MTGRMQSRRSHRLCKYSWRTHSRAVDAHANQIGARQSKAEIDSGNGRRSGVGNAPNNKIGHNSPQFSFVDWFSRPIVDQDDLNIGGVDAALHERRERPDRSRRLTRHIEGNNHHRDFRTAFGQRWRLYRLAVACWLNRLMRSAKAFRQTTDCPSRPTPFSA